MEKHPDKTVIGVGWASYWRFMVLAPAIEIVFFILLSSFGFALFFAAPKQAVDNVVQTVPRQ